MCGIIASANPATFESLVDLNQSRGCFSFSFSTIKGNRVDSITKGFGSFPKPIRPITEFDYLIGHVQAPTGGLTLESNRIHPARWGKSALWHNGILKHGQVQNLQFDLQTDDSWDTGLLLKYLENQGFDWAPSLSYIDGTFACLYFRDGELFAFRSAAAPLFVDDEMSFSSQPFPGSRSLECNAVFCADFKLKALHKVGSFTSKSAPYALD